MVDEELTQFKKDLIHLIKTDKEVKNIIYNIVVGHKKFAQCVEDINESNESAKRWREASAWV